MTPTNTIPANDDGLDIPAGLKREPKAKPTVSVAATKLAKAHNADVQPAPARVVKAKKAIKAKAAKLANDKPSKAREIVRTEANPAKSIVPSAFKAKYAEHNDTNGSRLSLVLKDATTMRNEQGRESLDVKALFGIAKANGIDVKAYEALNNGQKRMNVRNKLAGLVKAGKTVTIGKTKIASADAVKAA